MLLGALALPLGLPTGAFADVTANAESAEGLSAPRVLSAADRVAAQVQSFYERTETLQTDFSQTYYHALYRRTERDRGRMALHKPGRIRFDYEGGKVMVNNGAYLTVYDPGEEGDVGQYMKMRANQDALHQGFGFLTGERRLDEDYNYRLLDAARYRWRGAVLELRPRQADANIRRVLLYVDTHPTRAGVVHRIRIDDHDGNRNTLTFRNMRFNRTIAASHFRYTPPAGAIRMRPPQ